MTLRQLMGGTAAAIVGAGLTVASYASTQAAMLPASHDAAPMIHRADRYRRRRL